MSKETTVVIGCENKAFHGLATQSDTPSNEILENFLRRYPKNIKYLITTDQTTRELIDSLKENKELDLGILNIKELND